MNNISLSTRRFTVVLILLMIGITGASAFGIVWMQQQISRTADRSLKMEANYAETIRKLNYLDERIATLHQPVVLQSKVSGVLRPSMENQIVWVQERPLPTGRAFAESQPYETSVNLALIDISGSR